MCSAGAVVQKHRTAGVEQVQTVLQKCSAVSVLQIRSAGAVVHKCSAVGVVQVQ